MSDDSAKSEPVIEDMADKELTEAVDIELTEAEMEVLRRLAEERGTTVNEYLRLRIREAWELDQAAKEKQPEETS